MIYLRVSARAGNEKAACVAKNLSTRERFLVLLLPFPVSGHGGALLSKSPRMELSACIWHAVQTLGAMQHSAQFFSVKTNRTMTFGGSAREGTRADVPRALEEESFTSVKYSRMYSWRMHRMGHGRAYSIAIS